MAPLNAESTMMPWLVVANDRLEALMKPLVGVPPMPAVPP